MDADELIAFEREVAKKYDEGVIPGPVHLNSDTQAASLITIFKAIKRSDWVLSTWRSHWHALLHGVPPDKVMAEILAGRSMMLHFPQYNFMSSAIVGGMLPIACGLAHGGKRVWCFVGDMCASTGAFRDALNWNGDVNFVVEDNGLSTNTPTAATWGTVTRRPQRYSYKRTTPHYGTGNGAGF